MSSLAVPHERHTRSGSTVPKIHTSIEMCTVMVDASKLWSSKVTGEKEKLRPNSCHEDRACFLLYRGTLVHMVDEPNSEIERVQTGVRIEKRILKVLKAFAEYHDMTLGDVLEGIVLHAFDGKTPFSAASLERIAS